MASSKVVTPGKTGVQVFYISLKILDSALTPSGSLFGLGEAEGPE